MSNKLTISGDSRAAQSRGSPRCGLKRLSLGTLLAFALVSCRFDFDNPAETLVPGQIRGKTVEEVEGKAGEFKAMPQVRVRLRGSPFQLNSRDTGYFALLDLPVGDYHLLLSQPAPSASEEDSANSSENPDSPPPEDDSNASDATVPPARMIQRRVSLKMGADGQIEGVNLGELPLLYTASVSGVVLDDDSQAPIPYATVIDEVSQLSVSADQEGRFVFPSLAVGEHAFRAAGTLRLEGGDEIQAVGGGFKLTIKEKDERRNLKLPSALKLHPAQDDGRLKLQVALMSPGRSTFGLEEVQVSASPCSGGEAFPLASPSSKGQLDDRLPEGCWNLLLQPPPGANAAEFDLLPVLPNLVVLGDQELDLGTVLLASSQSLQRSQDNCEADADCGKGGVCKSKVCEHPPKRSVDPCAKNHGGCHAEASCSSEGELAICTCNEGYLGDGISCVPRSSGGPDDLRCQNLSCGDNAGCQIVRGEAACVCNKGYSGDGQSCEKQAGEGPCAEVECDSNATCEVVHGEALCVCDSGFKGDGLQCEQDAVCQGFSCGANSRCKSEAGVPACVCDLGYADSRGTCVNVNECTQKDPITETPLNTCAPEATCIDTEGSYYCQCPEGMAGDGHSCTADRRMAAVGWNYSCGLSRTGESFCWGANDYGQLGLGHTDELGYAVLTQTGTWKKLSLGSYSSCGIAETDSLHCWGENSSEGLGLSPNAPSTVLSPLPVQGGHEWLDLRIGSAPYYGVTTAGELMSWGNEAGDSPTRFGDGTKWRGLLPGSSGTPCAFQEMEGGGNTLWCWGDNPRNFLNQNSPEVEEPTLLAHLGTFQSRPKVALNRNQLCVIQESDRKLHCTKEVGTELEAISNLQWKELSAGEQTFCAISLSDQLYCWGSNARGLLGINETDDEVWADEPLPVAPQIKFSSVAVGSWHACATALSGEHYCWGQNRAGQLGLPHWPSVSTPIQVGVHSDWREVSAGDSGGCGLREEPGLWCWGVNHSGGAFGDSIFKRPTQVEKSTHWSALSVGQYSGCVLNAEGALWCFGSPAAFGGDSNTEGLVAIGNAPQSNGFEAVALGSYACAIEKQSKAIWCGGENIFDGEKVSSGGGQPIDSWTILDSQHQFSQLSYSYQHLCAISTEGRLFCVGVNSDGQILPGDLNYLTRLSEIPHPEEDGSVWTQISTGMAHTCAIDSKAQVWCWGDNSEGQLGVGDPFGQSSSTPLRVLEDEPIEFTQISLNGDNTCAIDSEQRAWCWGANSEGQRGAPNWQDEPPLALHDDEWLSMTPGGRWQHSFACGIKPHSESPGTSASSGSLWCWGSTRGGGTGLEVLEARSPQPVVNSELYYGR